MQVGKHGKVHVSPTPKAEWTTENKQVDLPARIDEDIESAYNAMCGHCPNLTMTQEMVDVIRLVAAGQT